jgi:hypothetical protein
MIENYFMSGWQHIHDFMVVHLTIRFKYDSSKVKIVLKTGKFSALDFYDVLDFFAIDCI